MPCDFAAVYDVIKNAFADMEYADGDEQDVVAELRRKSGFVSDLSLVAEIDGIIAGHILFTPVTVGGEIALCLGPVSVMPEYRNRGIGGSLITRGHEIAEKLGYAASVLIGHKDYYPRFGYEPASDYGITFGIDIPDECCMVKYFRENKNITGRVKLPPELIPVSDWEANNKQ